MVIREQEEERKLKEVVCTERELEGVSTEQTDLSRELYIHP